MINIIGYLNKNELVVECIKNYVFKIFNSI